MPTNKLWLEHTEKAAWESVQALREKLAEADKRMQRLAPQVNGWQSLLADAFVFALGTAVHPLAFVLILSTGPVVHAIHRNFLLMGISAGVRGAGALLMLVGGIFALSGWGHYDSCHEMGEARCEPEPPDGKPFFIAGAILIGGAVIMDAALGLRRPRAKPRATALQVQPFVSPTEHGAALGLAGAF